LSLPDEPDDDPLLVEEELELEADELSEDEPDEESDVFEPESLPELLEPLALLELPDRLSVL
jgi:hypothetical protein